MTTFVTHAHDFAGLFGERVERVAVRSLRRPTAMMQWRSGSDGRLACRWVWARERPR